MTVWYATPETSEVAARAGRGAPLRARPPDRGRRRAPRRDGDRRLRHGPDLRLPGDGGADRRGGPPRLRAPHRPRPGHRDARGLDPLREAVRDAPGAAAEHGHVPRRHERRGAPRARVGPAADGPLRGGLGGVPPDGRARRAARGGRPLRSRGRVKPRERRLAPDERLAHSSGAGPRPMRPASGLRRTRCWTSAGSRGLRSAGSRT